MTNLRSRISCGENGGSFKSHLKGRRAIAWGLVCLSGLLTLSALILLVTGLYASKAAQSSSATSGLRLLKVVTLPSIVTAPVGHAPMRALPVDGFDFQALDPHTKLLFISHPGPSAAKWPLEQKQLPSGTQFHGQLVVFETSQQSVVAGLSLPDIHPQAQPTTPLPTKVEFPAAHFLAIDPVSLQVLGRVTLSNTRACSDAHGLVLDTEQQVTFLACVATHTLMLIDLGSMHLFGPWTVVLKPDILRLDLVLHRLYVPGTAGVSILDESRAAQGRLAVLGTFVVSKGTSHTLEVDARTHDLYFPVQDNRGNPILRIMQFAS